MCSEAFVRLIAQLSGRARLFGLDTIKSMCLFDYLRSDQDEYEGSGLDTSFEAGGGGGGVAAISRSSVAAARPGSRTKAALNFRSPIKATSHSRSVERRTSTILACLTRLISFPSSEHF